MVVVEGASLVEVHNSLPAGTDQDKEWTELETLEAFRPLG